jgi:hypothetical protein
MPLPDESDLRRWRLDAGVILVAIIAAAFGAAGHWALCGCSSTPPPEPPVVTTERDAGTDADAEASASQDPCFVPPRPCDVPPAPGGGFGPPPVRQ